MDVKFLKGTRTNYNAIQEKDPYTFYLVDEDNSTENPNYETLYLGTLELSNSTTITTLLEKIGELTNLKTTTKENLVAAINENYDIIQEIITAFGNKTELNESLTGGNLVEIFNDLTEKISQVKTESKVGVETVDDESPDYAKVYYITQNGERIDPPINIPKDLVVKSGKVLIITEENKDAYSDITEPGTYIELTLSNTDNNKIYIDVKDLIDIYSGEATSSITVIVSEENNTITANINENGITTNMIADDAITNEKLADGTISYERLDSTLQQRIQDLENKVTIIEKELTWQEMPTVEPSENQ